MKKKPEEEINHDILAQLSQNLKKFENKKSDIAAKAQELIKKLDPNANDVLLKAMETSLRDLKRSGANDEQIQQQEVIVKRYLLGIKGKL
jgi:hypothetical protein